MAVVNGNLFGIYIDGQRIALARSGDLAHKVAMEDITNKDSGGNKESMPMQKETSCSAEAIVTSALDNKLQFPETMGNAAWVKDTATTATDNYGSNQFGQKLSNLVTYNAGTFIRQTYASAAGASDPYTFSVYLKGSGNVTIKIDDGTTPATLLVVLTSTLTRYEVSTTVVATASIICSVIKGTATTVECASAMLNYGAAALDYKGSQTTLRTLADAANNSTQVAVIYSDYVDGDRKVSFNAYISDVAIKSKNDAAATFSCSISVTGATTYSTV